MARATVPSAHLAETLGLDITAVPVGAGSGRGPPAF